MLFKINKDERIVVNPDALMLCPELKKLQRKKEEKKILYIIYAFDYESPYHRFPEAERIKKSIGSIFGGKPPDDLDSDEMKLCIQEYKSLQFDVRYETMKAYEEKIMKLNIELLSEAAPKRVSDIDTAIVTLENRIKKIQRDIYTDEEANRVIQGGGKMSFVEKWQENQKKFRDRERMQREASGVDLI